MEAKFAKPVTVLVGLGFPSRIRNANGALIILDNWHGRGAYHSSATALCRDAILGKASAEAAREAFVDFARAVDILVDEIPPLITAKKQGRGAPA